MVTQQDLTYLLSDWTRIVAGKAILVKATLMGSEG